MAHSLGGPSGEVFLVREEQGELQRRTLLQDVVFLDCTANGPFVARVKSGTWFRGNANAPDDRAELPADAVPPHAQSAYIAPDGRTIAWRTLPDRGTHGLIVRSHGPNDWKDLRVVSDHYLGAAAWSPAGDQLAYYSGGAQAASEDGFRLMLLELGTSAEPKQLAPPSLLTRLSPIRPDPPEWSPDGRLIRFEGRYADTPLGQAQCIVGVDGAGWRPAPRGRVWSADGTGFLVLDGAEPERTGLATALLMVDMNGKERRRTELGSMLAGVRGSAIMCSPSGGRLAYVADRQLHIVDLTTRQNRVMGAAGPGSRVFWLRSAVLTSTEPAVCREAAARVVAERQANIRALVEVASGDDTQEYKTPAERRNSPKRVALSCLGALRADDRAAIAVLRKNLEYRQSVLEGTLHQLTDPGSYYPAAAALVQIGKPACEEAWRELEASTDPVRVDLATYVLWRVEGPEVMQFLLDRKLSRLAGQPEIIADATPHKRNLERARAWIMDRAKDGSSGGKPPTIGGRPPR